MKKGTCPKCYSSNVFKSENGISLGGHTSTLSMFTGSMSMPAACESYVCVDCGYFENYIITQERLHEVQMKWTKVSL